MKLEIDIPSILYQDAKENRNYISLTKLEIAWKAIADGKPIVQEPQTFKWCTDCKEYDQENHCCHRWSKVIRDTVEEIKQKPVLDKIREQIKSHLCGVEITLKVLVENDPLRPKMEGAKDTLKECLALIDKAESEAEDGNE